MKEHLYRVQGMHCASCEILIEKKLLEFKGIKSVEASVGKGEVFIAFSDDRPTPEKLNEVFKKEGYVFSNQSEKKTSESKLKNFFTNLVIALLIVYVFVKLNKLGLSGLVAVNSKSSLPTFFVFGLIAGISSCAALVGGIILSMSKQWAELYSKTDSVSQKIQPHLMFNFGRLISYGVLGAGLGLVGSQFNLSFKFGPILVMGVSIIMIILALQMLGFKSLQRFQITLPRFITRHLADESNFKSRRAPFLMGALTFFLPCGFTITAQGLALISGSAIQGGLIMFLFALGTAPMLLAIGLSSIKFSQKPHQSYKFLKVAGILVLFFAFYNINAQLNVLGYRNFSDFNQRPEVLEGEYSKVENGLAPIVNGKQILKMSASARGYSPNYFKVRAGIPVRWEVADKGTSGCTNAIISKGLFTGEIKLIPGKTSFKEFIPLKPGRYKFSCWMGMITGVIEVI